MSVCLSIRTHISGITRLNVTEVFLLVTSGRYSVLVCVAGSYVFRFSR